MPEPCRTPCERHTACPQQTTIFCVTPIKYCITWPMRILEIPLG